MNEEQKKMMEAFKSVINETLPEAVKTVVKEETQDLTKKIDDVEANMVEFNKTLKSFNYANDTEGKQARKDAIEATGNFFKNWKKSGFSLSDMDQSVKAAFLNGDTDSEGGYMVPKELAKEVLMVMGETGIARQFCRVFPMGTDTKDITTIVSGVTVYWISNQGDDGTTSKPVFGQCELVAKKMMALVGSANELIEDNMTNEEIFTLLGKLIGQAMAEEEDKQVLAGSGSPITGVLNLSSANITTMGSGLTTFAKLTPVHLMTMMDSVKDKYLKNGKAHWYMDKTIWSVIKQLAKKRVSDETTAVTNLTNEFLNIAQETVQNGVITRTLFGYPVHCVLSGFPTASDGTQNNKKFIAFGDLYHFALGDRRQMSLDIGLLDGDFKADKRTIRGKQRVAAKAIFEEAYAVLKTATS